MTLLRFIISLVYSLAGVSGCVAFVFFENYPAAVLAIATGILSIVTSHIHFLNYKNKLQEWYTPQHLRQISCLGFYSFALSTSLLVYLIVIEVMEKIPIIPISDSVIIQIVWAFMTMKSGLFLLYFGRSYSHQEHLPLIEEPTLDEDLHTVARDEATEADAINP